MNDQQVAYAGLSKVAHAIRRVGALFVAMSILPEGSTEDELIATADRMAKWLGGNAEVAEQAAAGKPPEFMGRNPWE